METTEQVYELLIAISGLGIDRLQLEDKRILIKLPQEKFEQVKKDFEAINRVSVPYDGYELKNSFVVLMQGYEITFRVKQYSIDLDGYINETKPSVGPVRRSENTGQPRRIYNSIEEAKKDLPKQP